MTAVLIAYDLHKIGQRYTALRDLIKKTFPNPWSALESTFIVNTTLSPVQIRELLVPVLDSNDSLLVVALTPHSWATLGMPASANDWLRSNA